MNYRRIDLEAFPRRAHFEYFSAMADPYVGVTAEVELRDLTNLRQRIVDGASVEFERCDTSHTVMRPDGTYGYCRVS